MESTNQNLEEFVKIAWKLNKRNNNPNIPNKKVGEITRATYGFNSGYQFNISGAYDYGQDGEMGFVIDDERTFVFLSNGVKIIRINFPKDNIKSKQILTTLEFLK